MASQQITSRAGAKPPVSWIRSEAKKKLFELLLDGNSYVHAAGMDVDEIYKSDTLFQQYKIQNFRTNFKNLKKKVAEETDCVEFDEADLIREKELFPRKDTTILGHKHWDGSRAQALLKQDVKEGIRGKIKLPAAVRDARDEYKEFSPDVFRSHLYHEEKKLKETVYWQKLRNDNARKKAEKFMKQQKNQVY